MHKLIGYVSQQEFIFDDTIANNISFWSGDWKSDNVIFDNINLALKKVNLYDYSEFHIVESGSKYKFPIHDDIPAKILSGVIYLEPENNKGTCFFLIPCHFSGIINTAKKYTFVKQKKVI